MCAQRFRMYRRSFHADELDPAALTRSHGVEHLIPKAYGGTEWSQRALCGLVRPRHQWVYWYVMPSQPEDWICVKCRGHVLEWGAAPDG
jgi:hypothetical protein